MLSLFGTVSLLSSHALAFRSGADLADLDNQPLVAFAGPIELELNQDVAADLDTTLIEANINAAISTWTSPGCTALQVTYSGTTDRAATPGDGHNTIQWVNDWRARGFPASSPGITDVQYVKDSKGHWTISEADTYLNLNYDWTTGVPTVEKQRGLQAVLTHELGHALGLLHPCEIDGSDGAPKCSESASYETEEMYPIYSADQIALSDDDVSGVCFLYPLGCNDASCADGEMCVAGACKPLCGDVVCDIGTECKKGKCVASWTDCGPNGCVGQDCSKQSDCAPREYCDGKVCARGEAPLGDLCTDAKQCFDGACVEGTCAESCAEGVLCMQGGACDTDAGVCTGNKLAPMGATCDHSTDCLGGYCLSEEGKTPICSRSCDAGQPQCPDGWACRKADGTPVCAPAPAQDDGCTIAPSSPSSSSPASSLLALTALTYVCWRTTRRRSRRSRS